MWIDIKGGMAVLKAAWTSTSAAEITETESRIRRDAADDYLEQAETYFNLGRPQSAAILAGDVLEDALRKLCRVNHVPLVSRLSANDMNSELAKRGVYDNEVAECLSQLTEIWDKANCGLWSEFSKNDVQNMLGQVRDFVAAHAMEAALQ
jgi:hypothetical protein